MGLGDIDTPRGTAIGVAVLPQRASPAGGCVSAEPSACLAGRARGHYLLAWPADDAAPGVMGEALDEKTLRLGLARGRPWRNRGRNGVFRQRCMNAADTVGPIRRHGAGAATQGDLQCVRPFRPAAKVVLLPCHHVNIHYPPCMVIDRGAACRRARAVDGNGWPSWLRGRSRRAS